VKNVYPLGTERRRQKRVAEPPALRCVLCLDLEHVAGANHDFLLTFADICQKHHDQLTEARRNGDISMAFQHNRVRRVALALKSVATFLKMLAEAMWRWATWLEDESGGNEK